LCDQKFHSSRERSPPAMPASDGADGSMMPVLCLDYQWRRRALPVCRQDAGAAVQPGDRLPGRLQLQRLTIS
jgi:hypothetical protein